MNFVTGKTTELIIISGEILREELTIRQAKKTNFLIQVPTQMKFGSFTKQILPKIPNFRYFDIYYREELKMILSEIVSKQGRNKIGKDLADFFEKNKSSGIKNDPLCIPNLYDFFGINVVEKTKKVALDELINDVIGLKPSKVGRKQNELLERVSKKIQKLKKTNFRSISEMAKKMGIPVHKFNNFHQDNRFQKNPKIGSKKEKISIDFQRKSFADFRESFPIFQKNKNTISEMHRLLGQKNPYFRQISKTSFYTNFIQKQKIRFVKPKIKHEIFNLAKKKECRILTTFLISKILNSNWTLLFYDETTIELSKSSKKSWFHRNEPRIISSKITNIFLKINMIVTIEKIVSFTMTFDSFTQFHVAKFVASTCKHFRTKNKLGDELFVVMDNAPKNRSDSLREIIESGLARIVLTTPTTPQQNFIECIFLLLKQRLQKLQFDTRYVKS